MYIILKTIGNRKGDCAWSCSRWQTQPEKISKSQRTNQCHSLRTLNWFVLCNLLIFSGCVCHLEQLHAQSPFLFPIVFRINLIPFFDTCSVDYLLFFHPGCSGNKHQLGLFFLLEACQRNAARWSTAGWPANAKLPLPDRYSSISLDPCCSSAQAPSSLSSHAHALEHSTSSAAERVDV